MASYEQFKCLCRPYERFGLAWNPFTIAPLFKDFKDVEKCRADEELFLYPQFPDEEIKILLTSAEQRILVYGLYGIGKTSFVDFLLYFAHNYQKRFCTRVVISDDNLQKAIQEILLCLCFELLEEIGRKRLVRPVEAIRKWIAQERYFDTLMGYLQRLMGSYSEIREECARPKRSIRLSSKIPSLAEGEIGYEKETQIRKGLQTYVDVLPVRKMVEYLADLLQVVRMLGFQDIVVFVDEADHLTRLDSFLRLLTRSREFLFTQGYTFFVAGSVELAKHTEAMGTVFDKLIFLEPANFLELKEILDHRIRHANPQLTIEDVFTDAALEQIWTRSQGIRKQALRLAENALEKAVVTASPMVDACHLDQVVRAGYDKVALELTLSQVKVLKFLDKQGGSSPSDKEFQKHSALTRTRIRTLLEELCGMGYVLRSKQGRSVLYKISSQYQAYFAK